jgi:hypothetical protein
MSMSDTSEAALLDLLFLNTAWANIGNVGGLQPSGVAGSFYVALHTADPGDAGTQTTSEVAYTGYARVPVARSGAGWSRALNVISNAATVQFGECTAGSSTATHFSVGTAASGAGSILYSGSLSASRSISAGITPLFNTGALQGTID